MTGRNLSPRRATISHVPLEYDPRHSDSRLVCSTSTIFAHDGTSSNNHFHPNPDFGVLLTLHHGTCELSFCEDANFREIHPNAYAPASLTKMKKLGGGGSGVAVFEGTHPEMGDLVMKHGGDKDLKELFALATIAEELKARSPNNPQAAEQLRQRIPEFRMIYISPHHLGEKRRALWQRLRHLYKYSSRNLLLLSAKEKKEGEEKEKEASNKHRQQSSQDLQAAPGLDNSSHHDNIGLDLDASVNGGEYKYNDPDDIQLKTKPAWGSNISAKMSLPHVPSRNGLELSKSGTVSGHRTISVYASGSSDDCTPSVQLLGDSLNIIVPTSQATSTSSTEYSDMMAGIPIQGEGYSALKSIVDGLIELMKEHKWKFTLGQKRIGGEHPKTGNLWLYARKLEGRLLDNLISEKIQLVKDLASLTTHEEKNPAVLTRVCKEVARFEEEEVSPDQLSEEADSFVGNAIKKNFREGTGRFPILSLLGKQFREFSIRRWHDGTSPYQSTSSFDTLDPLVHTEELVLIKEEEIPAHHLGSLTRPGALMGDTFENVALEPTVLDAMNPFYWRNLLRSAIQPRSAQYMNRTSSMALTRIWTCGLTDAGLHNLFLSEDSLWLFDLGQPQLYSAPGFLTKFLFSFFHTLGMQEKEESTGEWVRRFEVNHETDKLYLTKETEELLGCAYSAFGIALDRMIDELFDGDDSLRWLLIQYVTLQLFSDASFCLQRWTVKGGGRARSANHQKGIEKWLWRSLWDLYIAFDINSREVWIKLDVEHPSNRESVFYDDMSALMAACGGRNHRKSSVVTTWSKLGQLSESENEESDAEEEDAEK